MTPMPQSTDKPKAENVTIATVRTPKEAVPITNKLTAANIESCLGDERTVLGQGRTKAHFGGVKIQVSRTDAKRAIRLLQDLQQQSAAAMVPGRELHGSREWSSRVVSKWSLDTCCNGSCRHRFTGRSAAGALFLIGPTLTFKTVRSRDSDQYIFGKEVIHA